MRGNLHSVNGGASLSRFLRRIARLSSLLSIGLLVTIAAGEMLFPHAEGPIALRDIAALLFFPIGVVAGMVLAWRRELAGGFLTTASLLGFYLTLFAFDGRFPKGPYFFLAASPGFLFLASWVLGLRAGTERVANARPGGQDPLPG